MTNENTIKYKEIFYKIIKKVKIQEKYLENFLGPPPSPAIIIYI